MAKKQTPKPPPQPALPSPMPTHPVVNYLQNTLGAEVVVPSRAVSGLTHLPTHAGNADLLNAIAQRPVMEGGLQDSNLATRPELYLGKTRPQEFVVGNSDALRARNPQIDRFSGGETWKNNDTGQQQVYVNVDRPINSFNEIPGAKQPFLPLVHELYHVDDNRYRPMPENYTSAMLSRYRASPMRRALTNYQAQTGGNAHGFAEDAYKLQWPSTVPGPYNGDGGRGNLEEAVATSFGLESVMPRGKLPWDTAEGAALFNSPERKGLYVEATRGGREPIARNPDSYQNPKNVGEDAFSPDWQDTVARANEQRGLGMWNALMNMRPVNQVVRDWFR